MTSQSIRFQTLATELWRKPGWLRQVILVCFGAALLTLSAKIKVPIYPVPMTMQSFVVLGLGMVYGWRLGAATVVMYLAMGALGMPVFAGTPEKGIGLSYMGGPTGGYLLGFVLAAMITGYLSERGWDRNVLLTFFAMLIGNIVIYVPGLIWLGSLFSWKKEILASGIVPFLYGDMLKIVLATLLLPATWKLINSKKS